ncbi:TetR family transcriptional regulator [Rhizobium straminoryzae]|uniref:TetR family transcriptional regulator n=1 Tax=Rhizobium straminoryzae TaxID=1387186 RepID=A0A549TF45_9HYPH|nr:TetR family transcriptional regulator [Rhizobium straminoryzae]
MVSRREKENALTICKISTERGRGRPRKGEEHDGEALIGAALACFAENGFDKTTLRTIAARARVDVALLSYRFGSKLGLWTAVLDAMAEDTLQRLDDWTSTKEGLTTEMQLQRLCSNMVTMVTERPLFAQLLISEIMTGADEERQSLIEARMVHPIHHRLVDYTAKLRNLTSEDALAKLALSLMASMSMIGVLVSTRHFLSRLAPLAEDDEAFRARLTSLMHHILTQP